MVASFQFILVISSILLQTGVCSRHKAPNSWLQLRATIQPTIPWNKLFVSWSLSPRSLIDGLMGSLTCPLHKSLPYTYRIMLKIIFSFIHNLVHILYIISYLVVNISCQLLKHVQNILNKDLVCKEHSGANRTENICLTRESNHELKRTKLFVFTMTSLLASS